MRCLLEFLFASTPSETNGSELWATHLKTLWNDRERVLYKLKLWSVKLKFKVSNKIVEDLWKLHWFVNRNGLVTPCLMHPLRFKEVPTLVVQDILQNYTLLEEMKQKQKQNEHNIMRVCTLEMWFHSKIGCLVLLPSKLIPSWRYSE